MFVFRSTYDRVRRQSSEHLNKAIELSTKVDKLNKEVASLKAKLKKAEKNDHRDSKGRFTKGK